MKLKYIWIISALILGYGLLPVTLPDYSNNFDNPNTLLVGRQECGCPCAEGFIKKGHLKFTENIKKQFPTLSENDKEITLVNFSPYNNINNRNFDFANSNTFKVIGQVIGVDTILCDPSNCEVVPKFWVSSWKLTSYYPRFWKFNPPISLTYVCLWIIGLPILIINTFNSWKKKVKKDNNEI